MCGIAGVFTRTPTGNEPGTIKIMCDRLVHRGPDDEGYFFDENIFLGMRRLSIIDLKGGHQPIFNEDKSVVIILNGEIYNYIELREGLKARGHTFQTNSDVEVVVHLYEEQGISALGDLNGMFAFCLWDAKRERGFIARDRLGIKPLYYRQDTHSLAFASELKALKAYIPEPEINKTALMAYLQYMFIPAPMTAFTGVNKLMPASCLQFSREGVGEPFEYWAVPDKVSQISLSEELESEFKELFQNSIELRLRSDVPVGIFLSGGIDSSLVTAFAAKRMGKKVSVFYADYEGTHIDERPYAEMVADRFHCDLHTARVKTEDVIRLLPKIIWHLDEPHADSAIMGTFVVSELASKYVKVVLNGIGGDELFAGYHWYNTTRTKRLLDLIPDVPKDSILGLLRLLGLKGSTISRHRFMGTTVWSHADLPYTSGFFADGNIGDVPVDIFPNLTGADWKNEINKLLCTDVKFYLTDDLLFILDKLTMAVSIEGRVPILDHKLVEWIFQVDGKLKIRDNTLKFLLKKWLRGILPDEILFRAKMGFGAPVGVWMKEGLFDECFRLINSRPESRGNLYWGLRGGTLMEKLALLNPQQCFKLLCLELWFRICVDNSDNREPAILEIR